MIFLGYFCNSNQKTQNRRTKDNYIEHAVEIIQTKKMIWWFYTNFSIQGQNLFPGQHVTTFELSCNQRLHLAQNWKAKIQWWCYCSNNIKTQQKKNKILFIWVASQKRFLLCLWARHNAYRSSFIKSKRIASPYNGLKR